MTGNAPTSVERDFHERMHAAGLHGLWELASQMTRHPEPQAVPHMWPAAVLDAMVSEAAAVVPVGEERRALQLFNPGLDGRWATTNTMIAAVQLLLPGEVARAHRHTPTAIRFIMECDGAFTAGPTYTKQSDLTSKGAPAGKSFSFTMQSADSKI